MPFHDITELPVGFCAPKTALESELSASDRVQITELLHRVYLCEDSRDYEALKQILKEDRWYLQHRVYQQMSVNAAFLPDDTMREAAAKTPKN